MTARVFGTLLTWLQDKTSTVFLAATANDVFSLPAELTRKGRFDETFFVDLPNRMGRAEIFRIHLKRFRQQLPSEDLMRLAEISAGFSGAEIEQAVISGLFRAFSEDARPVRFADVSVSVAGTLPLSRSMGQKLKDLRDWASSNATPATDPEPEEQGVRWD